MKQSLKETNERTCRSRNSSRARRRIMKAPRMATSNGARTALPDLGHLLRGRRAYKGLVDGG